MSRTPVPAPQFCPPEAEFLHAEKNGDVLVNLHVVPNAARTQPAGLHGEPEQRALRLRLHAPPVDGKANLALMQWLAECLQVPARAVTMARGETSRRKQLRVNASVAAQAHWNALLAAAATGASTAGHG